MRSLQRLICLILLPMGLCVYFLHGYYFCTHADKYTSSQSKQQLTLCDCTESCKALAPQLPPTGGAARQKSVGTKSVCNSPQCMAEYESAANMPLRIPSIRHILWKGDKVTPYFAKQLKTWADIQPDWKYILWRDSDLDAFVARYYTGALAKFRSLPQHIMRIDMIRYLILHRYGGVYADLDYVLLRPLDRFQKFPAIMTRSPEPHALLFFGMGQWPVKPLGSPAFMMSEPQHPFFLFCAMQLITRPVQAILQFAGPLGVTDFLEEYARIFPGADNPNGAVYVPASRNFFPMDDNSMKSSTSEYKGHIVSNLLNMCKGVRTSKTAAKNLTAYCADVNNLDPITDRNEIAYAMHDSNKSRSSYDTRGSPEFKDNFVNISTILPNVVMADTIY